MCIRDRYQIHLNLMSLPSIDTGRSRSCLTSGGSTKRSTASDKMKNEINNRKSPLMNPAKISALTYPKLYLSFDRHLVITDATKPARRPMSNINKLIRASFKKSLTNYSQHSSMLLRYRFKLPVQSKNM